MICRNSKTILIKDPRPLIRMVLGKVKPHSQFLDLGCGEGQDTLFIASKAFNVTALDKSISNIKELQKIVLENGFDDQVTLIQKDVRDFLIKKNKYSIINISNLLQFLPKKDSLAIIKEVKSNLKKSGFIIISAFSTKDPSYKKGSDKIKSYFFTQELLKLFLDFDILFYTEDTISEQGHLGASLPHKHGVVKLVARKP